MARPAWTSRSRCPFLQDDWGHAIIPPLWPPTWQRKKDEIMEKIDIRHKCDKLIAEGKLAKLRCGKTARLISTRGQDHMPIVGVLPESNNLATWASNGRYCGRDCHEHVMDIVLEPAVKTIVMNFYRSGHVSTHVNRAEADLVDRDRLHSPFERTDVVEITGKVE